MLLRLILSLVQNRPHRQQPCLSHALHPLDQPIPGAPVLVNDVPNDVALLELITELELFIAWQGDLAPHFAYGPLSKQQYYSAHYLHIQDHLTEISLS